MRSSVEVNGVERSIAKLRRIETRVPDAAARGLRAGAVAVFSVSQGGVPTLTNVKKASKQSRSDAGRMRASGHIGALQRTPGGAQVKISYGPLRYVRIQHYNSHYHHKPGEKARWLTDPFYEMRETIIQGCAEAVKQELSVL